MKLRVMYFVMIVILAAGCTSDPVVTPAEEAPGVLPGGAATARPEIALGPTITPTAIPFVELTPIIPTPTETPAPAVLSDEDTCGNLYYPVASGASWTYQISNGQTATHSMEVTGEDAFTLTIQSADSTATMDGFCDSGDITLLETGGISAIFTTQDSQAVVSTTNMDGVTLPYIIQVGDDWSQTVEIKADGASTTYTALIETTNTAAGLETVSVPAGTFEAMRIEQSSTATIFGSTMEFKSTVWFAAGVGSIKAVHYAAENTITTELTAYSIP